jgi:uncharacterized cofD-like protein
MSELIPNSQIDITAIVCVSDNGGSSGRLRQSLGIPAVGDLRNCLVALADADSGLPELFQYRFPATGTSGLEQQSLGNLILSALLFRRGHLGQAVEEAGALLNTMGTVLPVTESPVTVCAEMRSGTVIRGEVQIARARQDVRRVWLEPADVAPAQGVLEAITWADVIVLGPGSLFTSIVPDLLPVGVAEAIRSSNAMKVFVCNLMTEPGESSGFTASDHLRVLEDCLGAGAIDVCVLNSRIIPPELIAKYHESGSDPVSMDVEEISRMGIATVHGKLLEEARGKIRHNPLRLAQMVLSLAGHTYAESDVCRMPSSLAA